MIERWVRGEVLLSKTLSQAYREAWPTYLTFSGPLGGFVIRRFRAAGVEFYVDAHPLILASFALSILYIFFGYIPGLILPTLLLATLLVFGAIGMLFGRKEFGVLEWTQGVFVAIGIMIWQ